MSTAEMDALEAAANAAFHDAEEAGWEWVGGEAVDAFLSAAHPATILSLLALARRAAAAEARVERLKGALGVMQQTVEDAAYGAYVRALNDLHGQITDALEDRTND